MSKIECQVHATLRFVFCNCSKDDLLEIKVIQNAKHDALFSNTLIICYVVIHPHNDFVKFNSDSGGNYNTRYQSLNMLCEGHHYIIHPYILSVIAFKNYLDHVCTEQPTGMTGILFYFIRILMIMF